MKKNRAKFDFFCLNEIQRCIFEIILRKKEQKKNQVKSHLI